MSNFEANHNIFIFILASFMYCGSDESLWVCTHALTTNHKCVYAICSTCKYDIEDKDKKKNTKLRKKNDVDSTTISEDFSDPRSQNHKLHNLISFCDDQYFSDTYLSIMVNKG